jgi:bifunctional N-acetylglucosamine-1-phosphate-uridyltransferase/glucosamine-1-phosphate-acetyltransferase GlmU-like protein
MIDHLLERYASAADRIVVVVSPTAAPAFERHFCAVDRAVECVVQPEPTGMLPAVLCARAAVESYRPDQVWITWCDQIGISAPTVRRLAEALDGDPGAALVFPTVPQAPPYIHFFRDAAGRIAGVLQRRDGDAMPDTGESDAGLFAMRRDAYLRDLVEYDRRAPAAAGARERNFLPFIPWLAGRATVRTIDLGDAREAVGVNTPDDLRAVEAYLRERA